MCAKSLGPTMGKWCSTFLVLRVDTGALRAIEELAELDSGKVSLRGVNVGVYKVLKLARLTSRFAFVN